MTSASAITPTTCAEPGCGNRRKWNARRETFQSRYCEKHAAQHAAENRPAPVPTEQLTPAEVLQRWQTHPFGAEYAYDGRIVYGLREPAPGIFYAVLRGVDAPVRLDAAAVLVRHDAGRVQR